MSDGIDDGLDDGLSMLDVDALDSVSVSPDHAYAEIWDKLDAARRAIDAATGPQTQATTSGRFDSSSAPVIFSKVPLCPQPHAGIHADPLFACLDVLGDGQPRQFVVYHDKEGWRQLQSKGAGLHSVLVDNSASSFTFSANTARTARYVQVQDGSDGRRRFLHVIQSSLKPKKHARHDPPLVPNVYEMYRRAVESGREDDIVLYGLVKKKVLKSHKRVKLDTFVDATPRHARGGQEDDNGASTCRNKQNPLPPPPADLDHLAAASHTQWSQWESDHTLCGRGELLEEEEQEEEEEDAFNQAEAAAILKSVQRLASVPIQASIEAAVTRAELRAECWAALLVDDATALMAAIDRGCEALKLEPVSLVIRLEEWLWRPSRGTGPGGRPRGLLMVVAGNKKGVPKAGATRCLAQILMRFPPDLTPRNLHELHWALERAQELDRAQAIELLMRALAGHSFLPETDPVPCTIQRELAAKDAEIERQKNEIERLEKQLALLVMRGPS